MFKMFLMALFQFIIHLVVSIKDDVSLKNVCHLPGVSILLRYKHMHPLRIFENHLEGSAAPAHRENWHGFAQASLRPGQLSSRLTHYACLRW